MSWISRFSRDGDDVVGTMNRNEVDLLRSLQEELRTLVGGDRDPGDPAISRLFPPRLGDEVDDDFVDALHRDLLAQRQRGLDAVVAVLDRSTTTLRGVRLQLTDDEPALFLGVLNDLRLALGARIGIETLDEDDLDDDEDLQWVAAVMHLLGGWVEDLVAVLDPAASAWQDDYQGPV